MQSGKYDFLGFTGESGARQFPDQRRFYNQTVEIDSREQ
jgi:hypothetical protein